MARRALGSAPSYARARAAGRPGKAVSVSVEFPAILDLVSRAGAQEPSARGAVILAHGEMAKKLQAKILAQLQQSIDERGRVQRPTQALVRALRDEKMRVSDVRGFTLGNLQRFPEVKYYYRNLEIGTDIFVGRALSGSWYDAGGSAVKPRPGEHQIDPRFYQFTLGRGRGARRRGLGLDAYTIVIKNRIEGYHFFKKATEGFIKSKGLLMLDEYEKAFDAAGIDFWVRWVSRRPGTTPQGSGVETHLTR